MHGDNLFNSAATWSWAGLEGSSRESISGGKPGYRLGGGGGNPNIRLLKNSTAQSANPISIFKTMLLNVI